MHPTKEMEKNTRSLDWKQEKIEGEHCALRKGSFEGQAMVRIYFFVGTYIFHASPEGRTGVSSYTGEGRHLGGIIEHIFFETGPKGRN
jgi:hypothetical protein